MWEFLVHRGATRSAPRQYIAKRFYEDFGWTPTELRQQRANDILDILTIWDVEAKVNKQRGK